MTARLEALLATLIQYEDEQVLLPLDAMMARLADASGYSAATMQAFFARGLEGHILHGGSDGNYFVMGAVGMLLGDLMSLLGRRLAEGRGIASREAWLAALRQIAEVGLARNYVADPDTAELVRDALEPPS